MAGGAALTVLAWNLAERQVRFAQHPDRRSRPWMIALTANAVDGDRAACLAAGMDDYLAKPVKRDDLHRALSRVPVSGRAAASADAPAP